VLRETAIRPLDYFAPVKLSGTARDDLLEGERPLANVGNAPRCGLK
jgi:hypothetical protein